MTSASELFYQRRSRVGRTATSDLEFQPDRTFHINYTRRHSNHQHNHSRHGLDGCDPFRRSSPHVRSHHCNRLSSLSDHASVPLDQGTVQPVPSNRISAENLSSSSRPRLNGNDRLPGSVLLARERLVERLRGVALSGNRQSGRSSFGISNREFTLGDDLRVVDAGDWATDISPRRSARGTPFTDSSTYITERLLLTRESYKKPPGLTPVDLECLQMEVYSSSAEFAGEVSQVVRDCSICLESYKDGEKLIRLPCNHKFHSSCLDPWVRTCGDCPYCRRHIVVSNR